MFLALKRKLTKHALAEEDVVYPLLYNQPQRVEESKHMYNEHAEMKIRLYELEQLLKSGERWTEPVRSLRDLVRKHAKEEEDAVFPRLRQSVSRNMLPKVSGQIRREEALIA